MVWKGYLKGLKELIDDYGMTQKELADHVGIAEVSYQRIEYGQRPSLRTAIRIARALDTTVETLWGGNPI